MAARTLQDLYAHKLQDLYSAEQQILQALPMMIQQCANAQLRQGFELHLRQTQQQAQRLEQLFQQHGGGPGEACMGMRGIIQENQRVMQMVERGDVLDAAMIAGAQAVEHYEIAGYGTARTWARQLGREEDARLLEQTLQEEEQTDRLLTQVAESMVNQHAAQADRDVTPGAQRDLHASQGGSPGLRQGGMPDDRPSMGR